MDKNYTSYLEYLHTRSISPHTRRAYESRVVGFFAHCRRHAGVSDFAQIADSELNRLLQSYFENREPESNNSWNGVVTALSDFFKFCGRRVELPGRVPGNPAAPEAPLSQAEKEKIFDTVLNECSVRDQAIYLLVSEFGLRVSECYALNVGDVSMPTVDTLLVQVRSSLGHRNRSFKASALTSEVLRKWLNSMPPRSKSTNCPLFVSSRGERLSAQGVDFVIRKIGIASSVPLTGRRLRDTKLHEMACLGMESYRVATFAGLSHSEAISRFFCGENASRLPQVTVSSLLIVD